LCWSGRVVCGEEVLTEEGELESEEEVERDVLGFCLREEEECY
jgi:hypothetical protein